MLFVFTDFNCIALGPCFISLCIAQDQTPQNKKEYFKNYKGVVQTPARYSL